LFKLLSSLYDGGYRYFYTALHEGFDLLAVEDEFIDKCDLIVCWDDGEDADLAFSLGKAREAKRQIMNVRDIPAEE
jgi:hypothetical protein